VSSYTVANFNHTPPPQPFVEHIPDMLTPDWTVSVGDCEAWIAYHEQLKAEKDQQPNAT
jgi:hypothetical protein